MNIFFPNKSNQKGIIEVFTDYNRIENKINLRSIDVIPGYKVKITQVDNIKEEIDLVKKSTKYEITLPKSVYFYHSGKNKMIEYKYSLKDKPKLFFEFSNIGRCREPDESLIYSFIKEFGVLRRYINLQVDYIPEDINNKSLKPKSEILSIDNSLQSINSFYRYSKEAYLVFQIYSNMKTKNYDKMRKNLIELNCFQNQYENYDIFPTTSLIIEYENLIVKRFGENFLNMLNFDTKDLKSHLKVNYIQVEKAIEMLITDLISNEEIYSICSNLINNAIIHRTGDIRLGIINYFNSNYQGQNLIFEPTWLFDDLFQAIWLQFWLMITAQIELRYAICKHCGLPIVNPRLNQIFHKGHRQAYYNDKIRKERKKTKES